jgi:hypothetical protein
MALEPRAIRLAAPCHWAFRDFTDSPATYFSTGGAASGTEGSRSLWVTAGAAGRF